MEIKQMLLEYGEKLQEGQVGDFQPHSGVAVRKILPVFEIMSDKEVEALFDRTVDLLQNEME